MLRTRPLAVLLGAAALGIAAVATTAARADTPMTCTNPYSGASWQIKIDYDHDTVDANPAQIGEATIAWHDANDGGNYTLDRKSGKLTVIVASSTGGYFLYDNCGLH
jgi:hypothetical protein